VITDPLGRRLGAVEGVGAYNEIPYAFYPGNGDVEQILIPAAVPGRYVFRLVGTGDSTFAAVAALGASASFNGFLAKGQVVEKEFIVEPRARLGRRREYGRQSQRPGYHGAHPKLIPSPTAWAIPATWTATACCRLRTWNCCAN
jgi:hypothetical protein